MSRARPRRWPVVAACVVVLTAAGAGAWVLLGGPSEAEEGPQYTTAQARKGNLADTVEASFTLARAGSAELTSPASGTVTKVRTKEGAKLGPLTPLFDVNGVTIRGIPSVVPLYRDLAEGDEGEDVKALQRALAITGYDPGDVDGDFGDGTVEALTDWQEANGLDETGKLALAGFVSYTPGATILDLAVEVGAKAGPGTAVATIGRPGTMVAEAQASQLDVGQLKTGQAARLTLDADDGAAFDARVTDVAEDAEASDASAGSNSVVQFAVELTPVKLPAAARAGMTGTAEVTVRSRTGVVIVPSAAVQGSDDTPTVQVMENGTPVSRPVVAGLATASQTEIVTGVQAGETVVTGTISDAEPAEGDETGGFGGGPGGAPVIREAPGGFGGPPGGGGQRGGTRP